MGGRGARSRLLAESGLVLRSNSSIGPGEIREIETASEAKNFDELRQYMWDTHGITLEDEVSDLDFAAVRDNLQGLEDVLKEFPAAENILYSMVSVGVDKDETNGYADTSPHGRIALYYRRFKVGSVLQGYYSRDAANGMYPAGTTYTDVLRHEAGHLLILALATRDVQGIRSVQDRVAALVDLWDSREYENKILNKAFNNLQKAKAGRGKAFADLASDVSTYAAKNTAETFAECISDYSKNRVHAKALSKEVWKIAKKELT